MKNFCQGVISLNNELSEVTEGIMMIVILPATKQNFFNT